MNRITRGLILGLGSALAFVGVQVMPATAAEAACASLDDSIYSVTNPNTKQQLLTPWAGEVSSAAQYGFTQNDGVAFKASNVAAAGLVPVYQLKKSSPADYLYTTSTTERDGAVANYGFTYERVAFHVSTTALSCTAPVVRFTNGVQHNLAQTDADKARLSTWVSEGTRFHAAAPGGAVTPPTEEPADPVFNFGVIPDTQNEVLQAGDTRIADRNQWLIDQDSKFVLQTGDLNNWDTEDHIQYQRSKAGMDVLENADTPYTVAIGNHDTAVTAPGGSAVPNEGPSTRPWVLVRDTSTFNQYYKAADFQQVSGAYETGKVDNVFSKYTAGGKKWMVVTLEFCARQGAVEWARAAIAANPDYNVILSTHYFLTSSGGIGQGQEGYGSTSPQYVWDQIKQYPNVKMVFSGHTGYAAKSVALPTTNGNKVRAFLGTFHENSTNPVRLLTVNTDDETIVTKVYGPNTNKTWTEYGETVTDLDLI